MVTRQPYTENRLAHLLRLLPPAPQQWIASTQRMISELILRTSADDEDIALDTYMAELTRALELDPHFRQSFNADPVAASEAAGWPELARALERELRALVALAERVAADASYRAQLNTDPVGTLERTGLASATAEPLLQALEAPDDALARLPEVVAHGHERQHATTRLVLLLLRSDAVAQRLRALVRE